MGEGSARLSAAVKRHLRTTLSALTGLVLCAAAILVLHSELRTLTWAALWSDVLATPRPRLLAAVVLTAASYLTMTGYDLIAFATIRRPMERWRIAATSLIAYAVSSNVGVALLSGASVRYRFYLRWGVTGTELTRIVISNAVGFWLGLLALGGLSLMVTRWPVEGTLQMLGPTVVGPLLVAISVGYVALASRRQAPLRLGRVELPLPPFRLALAQLIVSAADWLLASAVLYVLLPAGQAPAGTVLAAFLGAQILALASHLPGGVGVFEGLIILTLRPYIPVPQLVSALVVYRVVYFLAPLSLAGMALAFDEMRQRRHQVVRGLGWGRQRLERLTPRLAAVCVFACGVVLLFSGATPPAEHRLELLNRLIPLGVIETSHVLGSVAGMALLLLSQSLARRLDAGCYMTMGVLSAGIVSSLLKGGDYEEALVLTGMLAALVHARRAFDRRASFFATRFSRGWIAAVMAVLVASIWLGMFAFRHVEYSNDLWWQFELDAAAPRFLRGTVAAASVALIFALARMMGHAPHEAEPPTQEDLRDAETVLATQPTTMPHLVFLGDKSILFNDARDTFIMYAVKGHTWVALGDPVGRPDQFHELIRQFLERCDDYGGTPAFYEVRSRHLHCYADFGLTVVKVGEEARVDLEAFTLDGPPGSRYRQSTRRLERDGCTFRLLTSSETASRMDELEAVSDDWLDQKAGGEKGFSLGYFDRDYLARFPIAVVERAGRVVAFANLWPGANGEELSVDLMRYRHDAPKGVMEPLFVHLMQWGKTHGYRWFSLGMAPMSGFEPSPVAPLWSRAARFVYEHGQAVYNFRGLRAYKEKFQPVWDSRYLACPGGLVLPKVLADISALVAGGYGRILMH